MIHGVWFPMIAMVMSANTTKPTVATSFLLIWWGRVRDSVGAVRIRSQRFFLRWMRVEVSWICGSVGLCWSAVWMWVCARSDS